jgi:hypothetical protein
MELTWLSSILTEIGVSQPQCPILWCDNISATYPMANPMFHACTKYIDIECQFVRDKVASWHLQIYFLSSKYQHANVFTKPLMSTRFINIRTKLNVRSLSLSLRGRVEAQFNSKHSYIVNTVKVPTQSVNDKHSNEETIHRICTIKDND